MSEYVADIVRLFKLWPAPIHTMVCLFAVLALWYFFKVIALRVVSYKELALRNQYASFFASVFVLMTLLASALLDLKYFHLIVVYNGQGALLSAVILFAIFTSITWRRIGATLKVFHSKDVGLHIGPTTYQKSKQNHIARFYKSAMFSLLLLLPFLILFVKSRQNTLVSFVIDNSKSMQEQLDLLVTGLTEIAPSIQENIDYVITHIPECEDCDDYNANVNFSVEQIISKESDRLNAENATFSDINEALSYLEGIQLTNLGSPLFDCIWSNYLNCKDETSSKDYQKKVLLVFSDGEDNLYSDHAEVKTPKNCFFDMENGQITTFFDQVSFISYKGMGGKRLFDACGDIPLYDGNESASIVKALSKELQNYMLDWSLVYFMLIITLLTVLTVLTTRL